MILGATKEVLPLVKEYMIVVVFGTIPFVIQLQDEDRMIKELIIMDYAAVMGLFVFVGYYILKVVCFFWFI